MDDAVALPMFPLGSVLFPAMPLPLQVFEPRYLTMLQDILTAEPAEFGVVLIERGQEVGGGEKRFDIGVTAQVAELKVGDGFISLMGEGTRRFEVVDWLAEDPYPLASVRDLPALEWDDDLGERRDQAEALVRRTLVRAAELEETVWSPTVALADDPIDAMWQLAAIAPIGPLDQLTLLRSTSARELLDSIFTTTTDAAEVLDARSSW
ncbi:LON peptidase substrate-binding domain-containing protein [Aeromicrobium sp.]|uniref:LON peptidase substrate-binding domain-containing protein n=1 Tax=Aeromicrobium sp. TaxID=1871063 RepID=UPI0025BF3EDB|nr:LON peptidase substrate-binding domain-containing protein [Aeromicrobium sp.]